MAGDGDGGGGSGGGSDGGRGSDDGDNENYECNRVGCFVLGMRVYDVGMYVLLVLTVPGGTTKK